MIKETNFHFLLSACHSLKVIFHQPYCIVLYFQNSFLWLDETDILWSWSIFFRTLFKDATARGKSNCINKQILKSFQRYPDVPTKYGKNHNKLLQELKVFKIIMTKSILLVYKICDEKYYYHCHCFDIVTFVYNISNLKKSR